MRPPKPKRIKSSFDVCFSPNGAFLASISRDVILWSCPGIQKLWRVHPLSHPSHSAFSPDSSLLAVKSTSGHMRMLSTSSGMVVSDFQNKSDGEGGAFLFANEGTLIVDGSWNGSHIVRTLEGDTAFQERFASEMVTGVLRHPSGRIWFRHQRRGPDPKDGTPQQRLLGRDLPFTLGVFEQVALPFYSYADATFSPDGSSIAILAGRAPYVLSVFSFPAMQPLRRVELPPELRSGHRVRFSPCGKLLAVAGADLFVVFSASDLSIHRQTAIKCGCDVDFSPTDSLVAVGSWSEGEVFTTDDLTTAQVA